MMKHKWQIIMRMLLVLFLATSIAAAAGPSAGETRIIIFHVNDLHSKIDQFSKIAWYVQQEKKNNPEAHVFFMNAGDNFSGNPVVDRYKPSGEPVRLLLQKMGVDVMAMGNHDFDPGPAFAKTFVTTAGFPVIAANIKIKTADMPKFKPYVILEAGKDSKKKIKIAVLGLIQVEDNGTPSTHPNNIKGIEFPEPLETAEKYRFLRKDNHVFMVLSHLGAGTDKRLAHKMGELDLIIGGHSHTLIDRPIEENGVLIVQAGGYANYLGRVELVLKNRKIVGKSGKVIKVSNIKGSIPELDKMIAKFNDNPVLGQVIGHFPCTVAGKFELGHLSTDAVRKRFNLDAVFQNGGGIRVSKLNPVVRIKDIYSLHPFNNTVVKYKMTLEDIKGFIKNDFEKNRKLDAKVSGIGYNVYRDVHNKARRIDVWDANGKPLENNKTYTVGMNDYMAEKYKFSHTGPRQNMMATLADTVIDYVKTNPDAPKGVQKLRAFETLVPGKDLTPIGKTGVKLYSGDFPFSGSSTSGNLAADALRKAAGSDVALFPTAAQHIGLVIPANSPLFKEYIPHLYPHGDKNLTVTGKMTGKDLKAFILNQSKRWHKAAFQVSGLSVIFHKGKDGQLNRAEVFLPGNKPISRNETYTVTLDDYGFKKYYKLGDKFKEPAASKTTIADMIEDFITKSKTVGDSLDQKRVTIK